MNSSDPDIIVTELTTEANTAILEEVERILGPSGLQREGRRIFAHTQPFLDSRVSTFPLMSINNDAVVLRVGNDTVSRTAEEYNHQAIKRGIESIHKYVNTMIGPVLRIQVLRKRVSMRQFLLPDFTISSPLHDKGEGHSWLGLREGAQTISNLWKYQER